ncbi:MAG: hypothetical protein JO304_18760 [Solirubrobacterales bacterium]|nr:hypothetical protein [Solirubrobacterales bacterium]
MNRHQLAGLAMWPGFTTLRRGDYGSWALAQRHDAAIRVERARERVVVVTAAGQELSALVAGG